MKQGGKLVAGVLTVAVLAAATGYWVGARNMTDHEIAAVGQAGGAAGEPKSRKVLYYRNPMGLPDTSPVPKKDPMGMDYIPVYEGEQDEEPSGANQIRISTEKIQKLGVRTEPATLRTLERSIRAAGRIEPDERRLYAITPKFEGYVERLHVSTTGQPVAKGQPLFEVYSPELVSAQREYAIAAQGVQALKEASAETQAGMKQLAESSLLRLRNWDVSEEQIKALSKSGEVRRTLTFRAPVGGIVTEKKAVQGMRFMPGEALYQVADLSSVWVVADVFEQDIGQITQGAKAKVRINSYPDKTFEGSITYVYPTLKAETRTVPVRIELPNPGILLKPGMFAQVELPAAGNSAKTAVVTVPLSAVIDSGVRQIVLVEAKEGRFEPREVKLGNRGNDFVEVREGVKEGERVVVAANFLIDAESNLKAAVGNFGHASHGDAGKSQGAASTGHHATGTVEEIDMKAGTASVSHGPVESLKWPAMTMEFKVANDALLQTLRPGANIIFEFVERGPGEWVITSAKPAGSNTVGTAPASAHRGH